MGTIRSDALESAGIVGRASPTTAAAAEHAVRFYEDDASLAEEVSAFVAGGLSAGEAVLVIATPDHRTAFVQALRRRGIDTDRAVTSGALTFADTDGLLNRFMRDGAVDRELCRRSVDEVLGRFSADTRVRAYGEMVDVLWQRGETSAALELEQVWREMQRSRGFALLCAYGMAGFHRRPDGLRDVCELHSRVHADAVTRRRDGLHSDGVLADHARALSAEISRRMEVEAALRASLDELHGAQLQLQRAQRELLAVTNSLPTLVCHVDRDFRYTFANVAYERWFGVRSGELVGKHVSEVVGKEAYALLAEHMQAALAGCEVTFEARVPYERGGERFVEASYTPRFDVDGNAVGFVGLIADISERKRAEGARELAVQRSERLMKITAAIADAVTPEQVYDAIVDQVAAALGASSAALWRATEGGSSATLLRAIGYSPRAQRAFERLELGAERRSPATDALASGRPVWIESQTELLRRYPHLHSSVTPGREYRIACLPVEVHERPVGALAFTFEGDASIDREEHAFLQLIAGYSGQALERLRLLEAEQHSRARAELLYRLAASANVAVNAEQVFEPALDAIGTALGATRAAILAFDRDGVMRFRAWRGLSAEYRAAVEGHSPWSRDERPPEPIFVTDVTAEPSLEAFLPLFDRERIASLGFIPLIASGRLIGKFMVYYDGPRSLAAHERDLANAIATHIASAVDRFAVLDQLQGTVRFNEMFTGMLGHDLRNPLAAIMTAAQLALSRVENQRTIKPLTRIVTSGMRMARMIDQLLDFTRVRVGDGIPIDGKRCDLLTLLHQTVGELEDANPDARIELECKGDCTGAWDPDRLLQVLSNLVANAVQHGAGDSGVRISVDGTAKEHIEVLVHNMGVVPDHVLPRLFEPMAGGEHRRERSQGLGLGLYISREIVRAHGGAIDVVSSPQTGTTFSVSLPRSAPPARE